jgi:hypothetical protein
VAYSDLWKDLLDGSGWRAAPALIWPVGPYLALFQVSPHGAISAALAIFVCGALLTFRWQRGSRGAAVVLLAGALVSFAVSAAVLAHPPQL